MARYPHCTNEEAGTEKGSNLAQIKLAVSGRGVMALEPFKFLKCNPIITPLKLAKRGIRIRAIGLESSIGISSFKT